MALYKYSSFPFPTYYYFVFSRPSGVTLGWTGSLNIKCLG